MAETHWNVQRLLPVYLVFPGPPYTGIAFGRQAFGCPRSTLGSVVDHASLNVLTCTKPLSSA